MASPLFREDIKGEVRTYIHEFELAVRNELHTADDFILSVEDTGAFSEYMHYLTRAEMAAAFKRAAKAI
jgi:hypothetical protein